MNDRGCAEHRGDLALRALGVAAPDHDTALDVHLAGCAACRLELDDLRSTAAALALASPDRLDTADPGPFLADAIVERAAQEAAAQRRRRLRRVTAAAAAAVVVAGVTAGAVLPGTDGDDDPEPIELAGAGGVEGSVVLVEHAWGTEVALDVAGLDEGERYWLWLTDEGGERIAAGTLTGTGRPAHAILAAALPPGETRRVWMTDEDDQVVLDGEVAAGSSPGR